MPQVSKTLRWLAFWSIPLAFGVMGLKFVAWYLTGSIALYSDALESIVNVIAALAAFIAIGYAQKPADTNHPYGHHKAEYFSAVLEGVLIVVAALLIFHQAAGVPALLDALAQPDNSKMLRDGAHRVITENSSPKVHASCDELLAALRGSQAGIATMEAAVRLMPTFR